MRHRGGIATVALAGLLALGAAGRPASTALLQSAGEDGLLLVRDGRRARVETPAGESFRVPLRGDERLTSLVETRDGWLAAGTRARGDGIEVTLVRHAAGGTQRMRPPKPQQGLLRLRPVPLMDGGRLVGLAWLEGDGPGRAAVLAAAWSGARWEPPVTVSPPGPGSQTGLVGAVLADGTWLLAWSRFDGRDDEITYSLRRGSGWDPPRHLLPDNSVPDISPALTTTRDGALLAWSGLDDDGYRLRLARFTAGRWTRARTVAGRGALYPTWVRRDGRGLLLYRDGAIGGWSVLETDDSARVLRRASIAGAPAARPALALGGRGLAARFPERTIEAAWEALP